MRSTRYFFILLFFIPATSYSQYKLTILPHPSADQASSLRIIKDVGYKTDFNDSVSRKKELNRFIVQLYANGYLAASYDSIQIEKQQLTVFLLAGKEYSWLNLGKGNVDEGTLSDAGFRDKLYRGKPVNLGQLKKIQEGILQHYENNGFPFAEIKLDSVFISDGGIHAQLRADKHSQVIIDSVIVKGNARLAEIYLYNYLSVKPGDLYNESLIKKISARIAELPMVRETRTFDIAFTENKARVYLYLEDKKASQLDGIIGIAPDASAEGKTIITGEAHIKLLSPFGHGELIDINWKQPAPQTQDLKSRFNYPFLFSTPFGIDLGLNIHKQDTTYTEVERNLGIQYLLTGGNYFKAFYNNKSSDLLSTKNFEFATVLPSFADITTNTYGLGYKSEKVDYRLNPRRGFAFEINGGVGTKTIEKNKKLNQELYTNIRLSSTQYSSDYKVDFYFPVQNRSVINIGSMGAYLNAPDIFTNELYRFGGLRTLRGFDEESIFASEFYLFKLEYRFILEQNSYLFTFINGAYYQNRSIGNSIHDTPYGFGAGITFETKLGIFSVNYALGKQFDNPILFKSAKLHFGIVNYF